MVFTCAKISACSNNGICKLIYDLFIRTLPTCSPFLGNDCTVCPKYLQKLQVRLRSYLPVFCCWPSEPDVISVIVRYTFRGIDSSNWLEIWWVEGELFFLLSVSMQIRFFLSISYHFSWGAKGNKYSAHASFAVQLTCLVGRVGVLPDYIFKDHRTTTQCSTLAPVIDDPSN